MTVRLLNEHQFPARCQHRYEAMADAAIEQRDSEAKQACEELTACHYYSSCVKRGDCRQFMSWVGQTFGIQRQTDAPPRPLMDGMRISSAA